MSHGNMKSMYEILMDIPLFRGVSRQNISQAIEQTKFHFLRYSDGETVVASGDECTHIRFVISGSVRVTVADASGAFEVSQTLSASDVIAPDFLFGRATSYPCSVVALGDVGVIEISKQDYLAILGMDSVYLLNFLNMLSMNAQKAVDGAMAASRGAVAERIAFQIAALTQSGGTDVTMRSCGCELCELFGVSDDELRAALEEMRLRGVVDYDGRRILVHSRREFVSMLSSAAD